MMTKIVAMDCEALPLMTSAEEFDDWLADRTAGRACVYHVGYLAKDAMFGTKARNVGMMARLASDHGLVHLVQQHVEGSTYRYVAVRSAR